MFKYNPIYLSLSLWRGADARGSICNIFSHVCNEYYHSGSNNVNMRLGTINTEFARFLIGLQGGNGFGFKGDEGISKTKEETMDRSAPLSSCDTVVFVAACRQAPCFYRHRPACGHHGGVPGLRGRVYARELAVPELQRVSGKEHHRTSLRRMRRSPTSRGGRGETKVVTHRVSPSKARA